MTSEYLTSVGYNGPSAPEIRTKFETDLKAVYGDDLAVGPAWEGSSFASMLTGIISDTIAAHAHEPAADIVANLTSESAADNMLDNIKSITLTYRQKAEYSLVTLTLGTNDVSDKPVPAGSIARKPADGSTWITLLDAVIPGSGTIDVPARSAEKGPYPAAPGSITGIVTNIAGWDTVTNALAAELGRTTESNADLRGRTEKRGSNRARIREAVDDETGVTSVNVESNPLTSSGPVNGIPRGGLRITVEGGTAEDIAQAIYDTKSSVAGTVGALYVDITDSEGNVERVYYDEIEPVPVYFILRLVVPDEDDYPDDGDDQAKAALVEFGKTLTRGQKLKNWEAKNALPNLAGVDDIDELLQGLSDPPTLSANLTPLGTQRFTIDAANITVEHV